MNQMRLPKICLMVVACSCALLTIGCEQPKGTLEAILDEYINYHQLDGKTHYLNFTSSTDADSIAGIMISFRYWAEDRLKLPEKTLKTSYRGISMYSSTRPFPIDHKLRFEKIITKPEKPKLEAYNEYFNELVLGYDMKARCIIRISEEGDYGRDFVKIFTDKKLICPQSMH